jgi:hypothetical protein
MQKFLFSPIEDHTFSIVGYEGDEKDVVIPDNYGGIKITVLCDKVFAGHDEIESVTVPDTVTDMGEFLFDGCYNLKKIKLPCELRFLWGYTFCRCGIEEIVLPDKLASIPPFAFKECANLKRIVCGKGLKKIYSWAFAGCEKLEEVVHGDDVDISPEAYSNRELNS